MQNRHAIVKSTLQLQLPPQEDSFRCQQEASGLFWDGAVPAMQEVFDKIAAPEVLLSIGRLEVELHFSRWEDFQMNFVQAVTTALEEHLRRLSLHPGPGVEQVPAKQAWFGAWLQFLEKGTFPGSAASPLEKEWTRAVLDTLGTSRAAVDSLSKLLRSNTLALVRLLQQHTPQFLKTLIELYTGKKHNALPVFAKEVKPLASRLLLLQHESKEVKLAPAFRQYPERFFWRQLLEMALVERQKLTTQAFLKQILPVFFETGTPPLLAIVLIKKAVEESAGAFPAWEKWLRQVIDKLPPGPVSRLPAPPQVPAAGQTLAKETATLGTAAGDYPPEPASKEVTASPGSPQAPLTPSIDTSLQTPVRQFSHAPSETSAGDLVQPSTREATKEPAPVKAGDVFYIRNAGMVLLHPFLPRFFQTLELSDGKTFLYEQAQHKAIHLLQYLATKELALPEYELLLPKLLCGVPFAIPVERNIELLASETQEAENLLSAVIKHWNALGATKPDGLREGFLQRDGRLEFKSGAWHLKVEHKTLDILLTKLPWGISVVKLPWMPDRLQVDWT